MRHRLQMSGSSNLLQFTDREVGDAIAQVICRSLRPYKISLWDVGFAFCRTQYS